MSTVDDDTLTSEVKLALRRVVPRLGLSRC